MTDLAEPSLPDLDAIPTQPPPPIPSGESEHPERAPRQRRPPSQARRPARLLVLILATQASLVSSAVLVAIGRPSAAVAVTALVLANVFMVVVFSIMLGMVGRVR